VLKTASEDSNVSLDERKQSTEIHPYEEAGFRNNNDDPADSGIREEPEIKGNNNNNLILSMSYSFLPPPGNKRERMTSK
jgi:hypothetical protein